MAKTAQPVGDADPKKLGKGTIALVVLLGLLAGGAILALTRRSSSSHIDGRTGEPVAGGTDLGGSETGELDPGSIAIKPFHGVQLPTSSAGPKHASGDRVWGFAHSPEGAALAAIHIPYRVGSSAGPKVFEPSIQDQVVGADKQAFLANIRSEYDQELAAERDLGPNGELLSTFARAQRERSGPWAYRVDAYSPSTASVNVLLRSVPSGSDPLLINMAYTLKWVENDWRLVAPLNGEWASVSRSVPSVPADYVLIGTSLTSERGQ